VNQSIDEILKICQRHAERLSWSMDYLSVHFPLSADSLDGFNGTELAVLERIYSIVW